MLIHYRARRPLHSKSLKSKPEPPVHAIENGLESADIKLKENPTFDHMAHQMPLEVFLARVFGTALVL